MASTSTKQSRTTTKAPPRPAPDTVEEEAAPPPKKKRGLLKVLVLVTLLLGAAGGGAWFFLGSQQAATPQRPGTAASAKRVSSKPPVFVALEPFTVNLQHDDGSPQYLQVGLSLKLDDDGLVDAIKLHMPEIRNRVLLLLSSKKASDISTLEGKKALSKELLREIARPLAAGGPVKGLESVLFTSFVIQ